MKTTDTYRRQSKDRLANIMKAKIRTTMIGALDTLEKRMGHLWGEHLDDDDLTPEQEEMRDLFEDVREEILDKGNHQIRNVDAELNQYDVVWQRYNIHFVLDPYKETKNGRD